MKTPTRKEVVALTRADTIASAEQTRWSLWEAVSLVDRQRAVGVAGLEKHRASMPLASFTNEERTRVAFALAVHCSRMEMIAKLMQANNTNIAGYLH